MRTTKVLSITLPEAMLDEAKRLAKKENRTMSELIREALRRYNGSRWLAEAQVYGEQRAIATGILTEADVDRVVHEARAERRALANKTRLRVRKAS